MSMTANTAINAKVIRFSPFSYQRVSFISVNPQPKKRIILQTGAEDTFLPW